MFLSGIHLIRALALLLGQEENRKYLPDELQTPVDKASRERPFAEFTLSPSLRSG